MKKVEEKYHNCITEASKKGLTQFIFEYNCGYYICFWNKGSWTEPEEIDFIK